MIGKIISHYKIIEKLGQGGMGEVYLADDLKLERQVALKFLPEHLTKHKENVERFEREAKAAAALNHPNIVTIYEIGEEDGQTFIVMEYVDGESLRTKIDEGVSDLDGGLDIIKQICDGLSEAHKADIVHRDIKPENIILDSRGRVKILDFGLAKLKGVSKLTKETSTLGTIYYMSPEQAKGDEIDQRSDIWSLGVIFYEILTGTLPFKGVYDQAIIYSVLNEDPKQIQNLRRNVPIELTDIITRCLQKKPEDRYSSLDCIIQLLIQYEQGITPASRAHILEKSENVIQKLNKYKVLILLVVILFVIFGIWELFFSFGSPKYLVVLPFRDIGEESIDVFYQDGILEIINSKLTQLEQFQDRLWIISGGEVRKHNLTSVGEAHDIVGADLAITGTVRRANGSLRYTVNLVETETFVQLKSKDLTVNRNTASNVEATIIDNIVDMLNLELGQETRSVLYAGGTNLPDGHDFYVRGRGYLTHSLKKKNIDTAIKLFELALNADSTFLLAYTGLGEAYWKKYGSTRDPQYVELAKSSCQKAMSLVDQHAEVSITCGIIYNGIGEYEKAVESFKMALSIDPDNATASLGLGLSYFYLGQHELSQSIFEKTVTNRPEYWQGHSYLGWFYYATGEYEMAVEQYQKIVEILPHSTIGYMKLAAVYFQMDKTDEFIKTSERANEIKPSYAVINNLGVYYYYSGDYQKAADMFKNALVHNTNDYLLYGNIATASYFIGQNDSARVYYKKAVEMAEEERKVNPRNDFLLSNLAGYYARLDSTDKAFRYLDEVKNMDPKNLTVIFNLGDIYEQLGEREIALFWMKKAIENGATLAKFKQNPGLQDLIVDERFKKIMSKADSLD